MHYTKSWHRLVHDATLVFRLGCNYDIDRVVRLSVKEGQYFQDWFAEFINIHHVAFWHHRLQIHLICIRR